MGSDERPNLLFVVTDQQRPDWVGTSDVPVRTPHYERLVERGVEFSSAVCPSPFWGLDGTHQLDSLGFSDGIEIPGKNAMIKTYTIGQKH
jgi:hypothetical protein